MRNVLSRRAWMQTTMMVEDIVLRTTEKATPPAMVGFPSLDLKCKAMEVNCMYVGVGWKALGGAGDQSGAVKQRSRRGQAYV